ncbi:MAG: hypothetical protein ACD_81C00184G0006 [uncultured bacterium]|uniref:Uncharacterized protein n=2 Tax=Candidatus Wolfeibacteriota TaxID=1752735 RepID=A0A0G1H7V7_9BACT|nr:MAG: hypothetical protein ACD_81C00184G0006 [uncultured bacterium]KKR12206.1 MAG: hypothetical protein UT41_C0003G0133 [Candidatus Wolfebacteria bacterium GW2011_GWC2_39_22]KKT42573.1 MAG: hypothetical protein UW32_C0005G0009 [Candidatus Wolfebacteria bacterium GW2011_GWE2_44_13]HBI25178.1 hypothetical protein [Candidatus Wolfebacteria bacterium]
MSKINKILIALVVVLAVALGVVLYWQRVGFEPKYSAVYLNTGDIYFGKLSRFPRMTLRDVWFMEKGGDAQQGFGLAKFENAFWGPEDKLVINDENIIWTTELRADSEVVLAIKNPRIATPTQQAVVDQQQGAPENEEVQGVE